MEKLKAKLTQARIKALLEWAYNSGKNNIPKHYFEDAIQETIKDMKWETEA